MKYHCGKLNMCLPNFIEFKQVSENNPLIGFRNWKQVIYPIEKLELKSEVRDYTWEQVIEGPHKVVGTDSGIYSYNNYNNYNYNNLNNYNYNNNYNYYNYYYYNNYNYNLAGIISQWGKVAIHEIGYRSEYARITYLFSIRELDAKGPIRFLDWIKKFNEKIEKVAKRYECNTISWQDFKENPSKIIKGIK